MLSGVGVKACVIGSNDTVTIAKKTVDGRME